MILYAIKYWDDVVLSWRYHYCKSHKDLNQWIKYLIERQLDYQVYSLKWNLESMGNFDVEDFEF